MLFEWQDYAAYSLIDFRSSVSVASFGSFCLIRDNSIFVTIPFNFAHDVRDKVRDKVGGKPLNKTQSAILDANRDNPNVTQPQLMSALSLIESDVFKAIAFLRKNGIIRRVGSNKTGYWGSCRRRISCTSAPHTWDFKTC